MSKKNCCIDMWYGDKKEEADKIDIFLLSRRRLQRKHLQGRQNNW